MIIIEYSGVTIEQINPPTKEDFYLCPSLIFLKMHLEMGLMIYHYDLKLTDSFLLISSSNLFGI